MLKLTTQGYHKDCRMCVFFWGAGQSSHVWTNLQVRIRLKFNTYMPKNGTRAACCTNWIGNKTFEMDSTRPCNISEGVPYTYLAMTTSGILTQPISGSTRRHC